MTETHFVASCPHCQAAVQVLPDPILAYTQGRVRPACVAMRTAPLEVVAACPSCHIETTYVPAENKLAYEPRS